MTRRGVALLTVLWVLTLLSVLGASALALARLGSGVSHNRIVLLRAAWAREACAEILLARYAERHQIVGVDSTDLGRGTWCRATVEDAGDKLDLNRAPGEMLRTLLGSDSLADALLDWQDPDDMPRPAGAEAVWYRPRHRRAPRNGPLGAVGELVFVRGFDSARVASLEAMLTVRGAAQINVNVAPPAVLAALPGIGPEAVGQVLRRRESRQPIGGTDELMTLLTPSARAALLSRYREYSAQAAYAPARVIVRVEGGVRGMPAVSAVRLTAVPAAGRLAVIRREAE